MKTIRKIVVATDLGPASDRALDMAVGLAKRDDAEVIVVHVVEPFTLPYPIALMPDPVTLEGAASRAVEEEVRRFRERLRSIRGKTLIGDPASAVMAFCEQEAPDLLVIGTHGRRGPSRWLLGSVAEKVVRASRVPVLTVREQPVRDS